MPTPTRRETVQILVEQLPLHQRFELDELLNRLPPRRRRWFTRQEMASFMREWVHHGVLDRDIGRKSVRSGDYKYRISRVFYTKIAKVDGE